MSQISCLGPIIEASPCTLTNMTCVCTDETLQNDMTICVTKSCTVKEALGMCPQSPRLDPVLMSQSYKERYRHELWRAETEQGPRV
jgi:hypothetical protein